MRYTMMEGQCVVLKVNTIHYDGRSMCRIKGKINRFVMIIYHDELICEIDNLYQV